MLALLRSRKTMFIIAGVVVVGLVVSASIGLFQAIGSAPATPPSPPAGQGQGSGQDPLDPPEASVLGEPPDGFAYSSDEEEDVHCTQAECVRLVQVLTEDGERPSDSEEAVEEVYHHLLDSDWGQLLPEGAESPDDVPLGQTILTDGEVLVADSSEHGGTDTGAVLMIGNANQPAS